MYHTFSIISLVCCSFISHVHSHGYMIEPAGRSSAWREGFKTPINYNDNELNCGGFHEQHEVNKGKCGVCGDSYSSKQKPNEPGEGNRYATGVAVATYQQGQHITITSMLTAFHKGYIEIKLCENDEQQTGSDPSVAVEQECFQLLYTPLGHNRVKAVSGMSTFTVKLPDDITCAACVLQWRYRTGNNWGSEQVNGKWMTGLGYGPQEEFINCADVKIISSDELTTNVVKTTTTAASTTRDPRKSSTTDAVSTTMLPTDPPTERKCYGKRDTLHDWCTRNCALNHCPADLCWCDDNPVPPTRKTCKGTPSKLNTWCDTNCNYVPENCPPSLCSCTVISFDPRSEPE